MHQALIILPISHAKQRSAIQTNLSNLRISKRMLAPLNPDRIQHLSTQQHVNITAAASKFYVSNVFDIHMIS